MSNQSPGRLNDSGAAPGPPLKPTPGVSGDGQPGQTRIITDGAVHLSERQRTSWHAHYAWKIHVGLDAPVWVDHEGQRKVARIAIVPPGVAHATGAEGLSVAAFVAPGSRGSSRRGPTQPKLLGDRAAEPFLRICREVDPDVRGCTEELVDALAARMFRERPRPVDARVLTSLERLAARPDLPFTELSDSAGLSLDRLSRLVVADTGQSLRVHRLWFRLLGTLPMLAAGEGLAAVAAHAGFSDHAHLTRTFRRFLGRAPSEFTHPPDVIAPW